MAGSLCQLYLSKRGHRQAERAPVSRLLIACVHQQVVLLPKNVILRWIHRQHRRILLREAEQGAVECCYLLGWCLHSRCRSERAAPALWELFCLAVIVLRGSTLRFFSSQGTTCIAFCSALQYFWKSAVTAWNSVGNECCFSCLFCPCNIIPCTVCKEEQSLFQSLMNAIMDCLGSLNTWGFFFLA